MNIHTLGLRVCVYMCNAREGEEGGEKECELVSWFSLGPPISS